MNQQMECFSKASDNQQDAMDGCMEHLLPQLSAPDEQPSGDTTDEEMEVGNSAGIGDPAQQYPAKRVSTNQNRFSTQAAPQATMFSAQPAYDPLRYTQYGMLSDSNQHSSFSEPSNYNPSSAPGNLDPSVGAWYPTSSQSEHVGQYARAVDVAKHRRTVNAAPINEFFNAQLAGYMGRPSSCKASNLRYWDSSPVQHSHPAPVTSSYYNPYPTYDEDPELSNAGTEAPFAGNLNADQSSSYAPHHGSAAAQNSAHEAVPSAPDDIIAIATAQPGFAKGPARADTPPIPTGMPMGSALVQMQHDLKMARMQRNIAISERDEIIGFYQKAKAEVAGLKEKLHEKEETIKAIDADYTKRVEKAGRALEGKY